MLLPDMVVIAATAIFSALAAVWWISRSTPRSRRSARPEEDAVTLLFDDGILHHASDTALSLFAMEPGLHEWGDMRDTVLERFPEMPERAMTGEMGSMTLLAADAQSPSHLTITWRNAMSWVTLFTPEPSRTGLQDQRNWDELATLRRSNDTNPHPMWQLGKCGAVTWHNAAYAVLYKLAHGTRPDPEKPLFGQDDADGKKTGSRRVFLYAEGSDSRDWYDLTMVKVDGITCCQASCINAVVDAEVAQRNFVQTLAKTFAHLSIGLAIFDRNGQLALFNPALLDLTGLRAEFLSARPTMLSFFDALRDNRRMPEPKNYKNWRQEISEVIAAASDGRYAETWSLESGQTYNVKGRPHPDGATAFLIEDISAEVTLTRNFRAELELGQSLLDRLDDALVVFSASGVLTFCNTAYRDLWSLDPDATFADVTVGDSIAAWKRQAAPNPMWHDIEDFVLNYGDREAWDMPLYLSDGTAMTCRIAPIVSGASLVRFRKLPVLRAVLPQEAQGATDKDT